jgi:hypothetical protein
MLLIDCFTAGITVFIPVILVIIGIVNNFDWGSIAFSIAIATTDVYPLAVNLLVILYIEPYRKQVFLLIGWKKSSVLAVKPTMTSEALSIFH